MRFAKLKNSIAKSWYQRRTPRRMGSGTWQNGYWREAGEYRDVSCRWCPMLDQKNPVCRVPFGTPLRKCVVASTEAHLQTPPGTMALEIGSHRRSHGRRVIEACGGTWTGIEPSLGRDAEPQIGAACYGQAGEIPFADASFDLVFGNQSLEHWEEAHPGIPKASSYRECLAEIARVLAPGGLLYLDAPIHLHGHEMFIVGDIPRIAALFDPALWRDVCIERWRQDPDPLPPYPTPASDAAGWPQAIVSYPSERVAALRKSASVWLLVITARRRQEGQD